LIAAISTFDVIFLPIFEPIFFFFCLSAASFDNLLFYFWPSYFYTFSHVTSPLNQPTVFSFESAPESSTWRLLKKLMRADYLARPLDYPRMMGSLVNTGGYGKISSSNSSSSWIILL
jgi:hypothetical protein